MICDKFGGAAVGWGFMCSICGTLAFRIEHVVHNATGHYL